MAAKKLTVRRQTACNFTMITQWWQRARLVINSFTEWMMLYMWGKPKCFQRILTESFTKNWCWWKKQATTDLYSVKLVTIFFTPLDETQRILSCFFFFFFKNHGAAGIKNEMPQWMFESNLTLWVYISDLVERNVRFNQSSVTVIGDRGRKWAVKLALTR